MSFTELLILAVIGLIVLGPEELPVMARKLAKFVNEIRKVKDDILGPLIDAQQTANSALVETRELMNKELVDLVKLRNQLEQEIKRRQDSPAPSATGSQPTTQQLEQEDEPRPLGTPPMQSPDHAVPRSTPQIADVVEPDTAEPTNESESTTVTKAPDGKS